MLEKIKEQLNEVIAIADECPEEYREKCFEILLNALLFSQGVTQNASVAAVPERVGVKTSNEYFSRYGISDEEWQRVINFDGETYSIIVSNLKEKSTSKKQIRLALLQGIIGLLETGTSVIEKSRLVELCKQHATYDSANFSSHMRRQKNLFITKGKDWALTKPGESKAAEVIKELAQ